MESRMRGNSHVRFGAGDEETCPGDGARRFSPTLPENPSALSLSGRCGVSPQKGSAETTGSAAGEGLLLQMAVWLRKRCPPPGNQISAKGYRSGRQCASISSQGSD